MAKRSVLQNGHLAKRPGSQQPLRAVFSEADLDVRRPYLTEEPGLQGACVDEVGGAHRCSVGPHSLRKSEKGSPTDAHEHHRRHAGLTVWIAKVAS